jgi:hypothetical protein
MKTAFILLNILILTSKYSAQNIIWAKEETGPATVKELVCGSNGDLYIYGNNALNGVDPAEPGFSSVLSNQAGTYLTKFSPQGTMLFTKSWTNNSFFIQKIIYDGSQYFYFTGFFAGNFSVDGINLNSKGSADGMIGKMDGTGTILWIQTFGSSKDEIGQGITFNSSKTSLIVTGSVSDSLKVNSQYIDKGTQSTLILQYSLSGNFQSYKLIDFLPQRDNYFGTEQGLGNCGREIVADLTGNYFLLTNREGKHSDCCSSDTLNAPLEGVYITKLNNNFDTLWSKNIIGPGCYYGWSIGNMDVSDYGDPYVSAYCGAKYGGNGFIERLNQITGTVVWNDDKQDGGYHDLFLEGNTLYTCGTDSANYCPCPDQHDGYQTLKTFTSGNTLQNEMKFNGSANYNNDLRFKKLVRDGLGNSYVLGEFYGATATLGADIVNNTTSTNYTNFVMKVSDNATPTALSNKMVNQEFAVFPNPSTGLVKVSYGNMPLQNVSCNVFDCQGKLIYKNSYKGEKFEITLDLSKEPKGLYLIELSNGAEKSSQKVMIE